MHTVVLTSNESVKLWKGEMAYMRSDKGWNSYAGVILIINLPYDQFVDEG